MKHIRTLFLSAVAVCLAAVSGFAMGRSEDPRDAAPPALGTDSDPAVRRSDEALRRLLVDASPADRRGVDPAGSPRSAADPGGILPDR